MGGGSQMENGKKRNRSQILGEQAVTIFKGMLPESWVVREYTPDYGIDLSVELFEERGDMYLATGEHVYFQIKGTERAEYGTCPIYKRSTVEKPGDAQEPFTQMEVLKFRLDTALLSTVERMGSAVPVLLVVVDLQTQLGYFVCLNDYVEKIIIPEHPDYDKQDSIVIRIPTSNVIQKPDDTAPIRWYGMRAKLYSLFQKLSYQRSQMLTLPDEQVKAYHMHFLRILQRLDAWKGDQYFYDLRCLHENLEAWENMSMEELRNVWIDAGNTADHYEAISREWFLPSYIGYLTSM